MAIRIAMRSALFAYRPVVRSSVRPSVFRLAVAQLVDDQPSTTDALTRAADAMYFDTWQWRGRCTSVQNESARTTEPPALRSRTQAMPLQQQTISLPVSCRTANQAVGSCRRAARHPAPGY